jgi:hypothetical protein
MIINLILIEMNSLFENLTDDDYLIEKLNNKLNKIFDYESKESNVIDNDIGNLINNMSNVHLSEHCIACQKGLH